MNNALQLEEALTLALRLSPRQRIQLIERIASSVEHEIEADVKEPVRTDAHWGRNLVRLLDEIGAIQLVHPEIEDPTEWVKTMRRESKQRLDAILFNLRDISAENVELARKRVISGITADDKKRLAQAESRQDALPLLNQIDIEPALASR